MGADESANECTSSQDNQESGPNDGFASPTKPTPRPERQPLQQTGPAAPTSWPSWVPGPIIEVTDSRQQSGLPSGGFLADPLIRLT